MDISCGPSGGGGGDAVSFSRLAARLRRRTRNNTTAIRIRATTPPTTPPTIAPIGVEEDSSVGAAEAVASPARPLELAPDAESELPAVDGKVDDAGDEDDAEAGSSVVVVVIRDSGVARSSRTLIISFPSQSNAV